MSMTPYLMGQNEFYGRVLPYPATAMRALLTTFYLEDDLYSIVQALDSRMPPHLDRREFHWECRCVDQARLVYELCVWTEEL